MTQEYEFEGEDMQDEQIQAPDAMCWENAILEEISMVPGDKAYAKFKIRQNGSRSQYPTNMSWFYGQDPMAPALIQSLRKGMICTVYFADTTKPGQFGMTTYHNIKAIIPTGAMAPMQPTPYAPAPVRVPPPYSPQPHPTRAIPAQGQQYAPRPPIQANSKDLYWEKKEETDKLKDARISKHGALNTAVELMKLSGDANPELFKGKTADQLLQVSEVIADAILGWLEPDQEE